MVASGVGAGVFFLLHATKANNVSKSNIFFMPDRFCRDLILPGNIFKAKKRNPNKQLVIKDIPIQI